MRYRTIVADPPWALTGDAKARSRPWASKGGRRSRETFFPYKTQTLEDRMRAAWQPLDEAA